ncbi:probable cytochrome P450 12e1, mitochondrial [Physella acuta]|uniref:probable cytochrome P450 12e1, mitochondrial n=1 Tax=Physella acuta TaxID=109671 RepID=UPI0027DC06C9|nr:probable cytochrome P450 12e1, mitochondrial [Physella acuta]
MRRAKNLFQPAVGVWGSRLSVRGASGMTHPTTDQLEVRPFEEIPGPRGPYQWPVIGTLLLFKPFSQYTAETVHKMVDAMFQRYGPVVKLQLGKQVIMACDPKDIETVFRNEGKFPHRPPFSLEKVFAERNNLTRSLTMAQGEDWYTYRAPYIKPVYTCI